METLIRYWLRVDPDTLSDEEFRLKCQEALWLEHRAQDMAGNAAAKAFSGE